jgi:RHS repeat-associated protein
MRRLCLAVVWVLLAPAAFAATLTPGTLQGQFQVAPDGAGTYSIPIKTPPGVGGLEPKIALSYNSRGGPSPFGVGWTLSGYSVIQRGPRNLRDDGFVRGVQLDAGDALFLDGEKLVLVRRSQTEAEYRTRTDSFSRVRAFLNKSGLPESFLVETKVGTRLRFGATDNGRSRLPQGAVTTWLLESIEDRWSNYITFRYLHDGLDYFLEQVQFTGNRHAALLPTSKLAVEYATVDVYATRYVVGERVDQRKRATSIVVSAVAGNRETVFRRYELKQGNTNESDKRKVAQLLEVAEHAPYGGEPLVFRPTRFEYSSAEPRWQASDILESIKDLPDGPEAAGLYRAMRVGAAVDGVVPTAIAINAAIGGKEIRATLKLELSSGRWVVADDFRLPVKVAGDSAVALVDVDGDGRDDIINSGSAAKSAATFTSTDSGWSAAAAPPPFAIRNGSIERSGVVPVTIAASSGKRSRVFLWTDGAASRASIFEAGTWQDAPGLASPVTIASAGLSRNAWDIDVDCDGVPELVVRRDDGSVAVFRHAAGKWVAEPNSKFTPAADLFRYPDGLRMVDINGDGCPDLFSSVRAGGKLKQRVSLASNSGWADDAHALPDAALWDADTRNADAEIFTAPDSKALIATNDGRAWRLESSGWTRNDLYALPDRVSREVGERRTTFAVVPTGKGRPSVLVFLPRKGDGTRLARVAYFNSAKGWEFDRQYSVPIDISVFDKVDVGVRFVDLNGDGHPDVVWSRKRSDGNVDKAAYIFQPGGAAPWVRDDRYALPTELVNDDATPTGVQMLDVNGDGLTDLVMSAIRIKPGGQKVKESRTWINCARQLACASPDTKTFWVDDAGHTLPDDVVLFEEGQGARGVRLLDLDGDGLTDILTAESREVWETRTDGQTVFKGYEVLSVSYINDGKTWQKAPRFALPVAFVRPLVLKEAAPDPNNVGADEPSQLGGVTLRDNRVEIVDLDGNRLPDVVFSFSAVEKKLDDNGNVVLFRRDISGALLNTGGGWATAAGYTPPFRLDDEPGKSLRLAQFEDLNGDGYVDLIYADGTAGASRTFLNTGTRWSMEDPRFRVPDAAIRPDAGDQGFRLFDVNGDGLPDIVYAWTDANQQEKRGSFLNTGVGFVPGKADDAPQLLFAELWRGDTGVRPADLNGDAVVDLVQSFRTESATTRKTFLNLSGKSDLLTSVKNGLGEFTWINYASFLASEPRSVAPDMPASPRLNLGEVTQSSYPILAVPLPGYVVRKVVVEAPGVASRSSAYRYDGYKIDVLSGRSLGFASFESIDIERNSAMLTSFLQEDGLVGTVASVRSTIGKSVVSEMRNDWRVVARTGLPLQPGAAFRPSILTRELVTTAARKLDLFGEVLSEQTDSFAYDEFGSALRIETRFGNGEKSLTENIYRHDVPGWLVGKLAKARVTLSAPGKKPQSRVARFEYDPATGAMSEEVEFVGTAAEVRKRYSRDAFGNVVLAVATASDGTAARKIETSYDASGRFIVRTTNSLGHTESAAFDPVSGMVLERKDPNGVAVRYEYDALQRPVRETSPTGESTIQKLDFAAVGDNEVAMVITRTVAGFSPSTTFIDAAGRVRRTRSVLADGRRVETRSGYNALGQLVWESLPYSSGETELRKKFRYDGLDRLVRETRPDGSSIRVEYRGLRVISVNANGQATTLWKDQRGRTIRTRDAAGGITTFEHDVAGRLTATRNALGESSTQEYDELGRRVAVTTGTGKWAYRYDGFGAITEQVDPREIWTRLSYDALGRLVSRQTPRTRSDWVYDTSPNGLGRLASATSGTVARSIAYDAVGRVAEEVHTNGADRVQVKYMYDSWNRPVSKSFSTGVSLHSHYNSFGFVDRISLKPDSGPEEDVWKLIATDSTGRIRADEYGAGIRNTRDFDSRSGRLTRMESRAGGGVLAEMTLVTDMVGNIVRAVDSVSGGADRYTYDELNRLVSINDGQGSVPVTVRYDALGNILTKSGVGSYEYCRSASGAALLCGVRMEDGTLRKVDTDAAGNIVRNGTLRLGFDDRGLVESVSDDAGAGPRYQYTQFLYNADQQLAEQVTRTGATKYSIRYFGDVEIVREEFAEPFRPTAERTRVRHFIGTPAGTIGYFEKTFLHFPYAIVSSPRPFTFLERPLRTTSTGSALRFLVKDHMGSVRAVVSAVGEMLERFAYDAWGQRQIQDRGRKPPFTSLRQGFTGHQQLDQFGLVHMGGRIYDATLGRFMSADILLQAPEYSQSHNRYAYAFNNPLRFLDPTGFLFEGVPVLGDIERGVKKAWNAVKSFYDSTLGKLHNWALEQLHKAGKWLEQNWKVVVVIAVAVALGPAAIAAYGPIMGGALVGAVTGGLGAALQGGNLSDVLQSAALGAFLGAWGGGMSAGITASTSAGAVRTGLLAGVSGVKSMVRGGRFESGFYASLVSQTANPHIEQIDDSDLRVAAAAAAGGAGAQLGGGKFEDGALNAAFERMFQETIYQPAPAARPAPGVITSIFGKIWSAPNSLIGLCYGVYSWARSGEFPNWAFRNNALEIYGDKYIGTAMTFGNVIVYGVDPKGTNDFGVAALDEEHFHSLQGQVLGPLYFPAHVLGGGWSMMTGTATQSPGETRGDWAIRRWHENNWMETGPQEHRRPF